MTLIKQHVKMEWLSVLIWSLVLAALIFYTVVMWKQMDAEAVRQMERLFEQVPESLAVLYGAGVSIGTITGWVQAYAFGSWTVVIYLVFTALFVVGMVTREMDRRTMEFLLSLPVARWQVILSRWVGMAGALLVLHAVHLGAVLAGLGAIDQSVPMERMLWAELNSWLLFLALGGIFLVISLFVDDYGRGVAATLGLAFGLFFAYSALSGAEGSLQNVRNAIPFALYDYNAIIGQGEVPGGDLLVLALVAALTLALSIWLFERKQIAV